MLPWFRQERVKPAQIFHVYTYMPYCNSSKLCSFAALFTILFTLDLPLCNLGTLWIYYQRTRCWLYFPTMCQTTIKNTSVTYMNYVYWYMFKWILHKNDILFVCSSLKCLIMGCKYLHWIADIPPGQMYMSWFCSTFTDKHKIRIPCTLQNIH